MRPDELGGETSISKPILQLFWFDTRVLFDPQGMPEELADGRAPELQSLHLPLPGPKLSRCAEEVN